MMKKALPVIVALLLICIIAAIAFGEDLLEDFFYSRDLADLDEYYAVEDAAIGDADGNLAIVLQDELLSERAVVRGGRVYFELDTVRAYLNDIFYADMGEGKLLLTTADDTAIAVFGESQYQDGGGVHQTEYVVCYAIGEKLYVAAEYARQFGNFAYEKFDRHLQLRTEWGVVETYKIEKDTQLRVQGDKKSPILRELAAGETVKFLEESGKWKKVKTSDSMIGFVEDKRLTGLNTEVETPITDYVPVEYTSLSVRGDAAEGNAEREMVSLGWHAVGSVAGNNTLEQAVQEGKGINVIAPTWFSLKDSEGELFRSFASTEYVERAHGYGLEVWGVWDDFNYRLETKAEVDSYSILSSTARRQEMAQNIADTALQYGLDGINIDFEELSDDAVPHFNQFLRELSVLCRKNGLVLSVDNKVPLNSLNKDRLDIQGRVVDYAIMMGYDEHWGNCGNPGSVASIGFVMDGLDWTLEQIPAAKVVNALPFYTRIWKTENGTVTDAAFAISKLEERLKEHGRSLEEAQWNDEICQKYMEWQEGDAFYQVWIEDEESLRAKINAMMARNIGGVAVWRLGYGTKAAWELVAAYVGSK